MDKKRQAILEARDPNQQTRWFRYRNTGFNESFEQLEKNAVDYHLQMNVDTSIPFKENIGICDVIRTLKFHEIGREAYYDIMRSLEQLEEQLEIEGGR